MIEKIGLLGGGGQSSEIKSYMGSKNIAFCAVDKNFMTMPDHIDISHPSLSEKETPVIACLGAPWLRKRMIQRWPGERFATYLSPEAYVGSEVEIDEGVVIAPKVALSTAIKIGKHSLINISSSLSHNDNIGDFVTVSPGAHLAGDVILGDGCFIGIGAVINNNVELASGVVVGAGAVVLNSVYEENSVLVGVPAKVKKVNEGWLYNV